jgi:hypothetical protein
MSRISLSLAYKRFFSPFLSSSLPLFCPKGMKDGKEGKINEGETLRAGSAADYGWVNNAFHRAAAVRRAARSRKGS